ncbi:MAG: metalloregulator ArsR/SmtB family transcription factor, partial [Pseudomonadota bacterium]
FMHPANEQLIHAFKALAEPVRLRIVALCSSGECAVSELTHVLGLSQPRVSQHLKALCDAGLLTRFRDGQFVYYRGASQGPEATLRRRLLELMHDDDVFAADLARLHALRSDAYPVAVSAADDDDRILYRHLIDLSVAAPLGDLLDIGCGRGDVLKLLASRSNRAVGVDIDPQARRLARAELLTAGIPNCSLRKGDMYQLPFADGEFDTVILDDTLQAADDPVTAVREASRVGNGRLVFLSTTDSRRVRADAEQLGQWCAAADLRLSPPRAIPASEPRWLIAVATHTEQAGVAA